MVASMTAFTVNDTFFKLLNDELPFFQALFLRTLLVAALMYLMARRIGALTPHLQPGDRTLVAIRTLAEVGAAYFFLTALINLPIANVTAIIQALPLTVTLGAALVLRESIGWRRLVAISIGLVGVLMIVRPGGADFSIYSLYAVGAVVCVTFRDLAARRISKDVPSLFIAFATSLGVLGFAALGAAFTEWGAVTGTGAVYLGASGVFVMGAYLFSVMAMRVGEIGVVSQFRYTSLLVALVIGFLVFDEWPNQLTILGAAIVVATGLFTLWRERAVSG